MRYEFSDPFHQYSYYLTVEPIRDIKKVTLEVRTLNANFPDCHSTKVELFMKPTEWDRFKKYINTL